MAVMQHIGSCAVSDMLLFVTIYLHLEDK